MHIIILYGEMGSGKNYQGIRLANILGAKFFDGDDAISGEMLERARNFKSLPEKMLWNFVNNELFNAIIKESEGIDILVVAQALYHRHMRDALRDKLQSRGYTVAFKHVRVPFFQHMKQLWSRPQGLKWVLYGLISKPFFQH